LTAPNCIHCSKPAKPVTGAEIYPHLSHLHDGKYWLCAPCNAYVGSHKDTGLPLGFPANREVRSARQQVHKKLDPIWKVKANKWKRDDVYGYLALSLDLSRDQTHTAMFDLDRCRDAWRALNTLERQIVAGHSKDDIFELLDASLSAHSSVIE